MFKAKDYKKILKAGEKWLCIYKGTLLTTDFPSETMEGNTSQCAKQHPSAPAHQESYIQQS